MDKKIFSSNNFFDLSSVAFSSLFENKILAWEVLFDLSDYIQNQFYSGKIKGNYKENVFVGEGTTIHKSVEIIGPAIIGKNCSIAHSAYLREYCLLGDGVTIGHAVEIKNTIIMNNTACAHLSYIGDSIVGNNINIGGGAIVTNTRLDKENVMIKMHDKKLDTGLKKFGSIIGDNSSISANAVLNPGTLLGKNSFVYPLASVNGYYGDESRIK